MSQIFKLKPPAITCFNYSMQTLVGFHILCFWCSKQTTELRLTQLLIEK